MGDKKMTPSLVSDIAEAYLAGFRRGLGRYNSAEGFFDFEVEAQKGAEKAAESAKAQGWEVSPEEIEQIKQRIIHGFFEWIKDTKSQSKNNSAGTD